jgi:phosphate transport system permease protein
MRRRVHRAGDQLFAALVCLSAAAILAVFGWLLSSIVMGGLANVSWQFIASLPENSGRSGGILPILISTIVVILIALVAAVPLGLATAIWLNEFARSGNRLARLTHLSLDILAGVPSIVFGLFGNAFFSTFLGLGFSLLSGGLTLACMILPIFIRAVESGLAKVPNEWRAGAAALGISKVAILRHVLVPAAVPAINAGLMLGIGRAIAETAALIFTSGYVDRMPGSILDSGRTLAVHIYDLSMNVTGGDKAAYASSLVLIALLLMINSGVMHISDRLLSRRIFVQ